MFLCFTGHVSGRMFWYVRKSGVEEYCVPECEKQGEKYERKTRRKTREENTEKNTIFLLFKNKQSFLAQQA